MAATIPAHAVIASFRFEDGASNALHKLKDIGKAQRLGIQNAAVLTVNLDGKLRIKETADMGGGKGMAVGGVVGGVIGLFGSAVLWPLGIGAAVGGLASKLRDSGFPNQRLQEVGDRLRPGDSLLIVAVDDAAVEPVSAILKDAGADVVREAVDGKVVEELEAAAEAAPAEPPSSVEVSGVQDCPDGYPIKGNVTARARIYHVPASPVYAATDPEICFATEDAARDAGFRPPTKTCRNSSTPGSNVGGRIAVGGKAPVVTRAAQFEAARVCSGPPGRTRVIAGQGEIAPGRCRPARGASGSTARQPTRQRRSRPEPRGRLPCPSCRPQKRRHACCTGVRTTAWRLTGACL